MKKLLLLSFLIITLLPLSAQDANKSVYLTQISKRYNVDNIKRIKKEIRYLDSENATEHIM